MVSVTERVWRTAHKEYVRLLPQAIGVSPRGRSKRLERVLTDFGCEHSFKHAAARVLEHYGFEINVSTVREATLEHAARAPKTPRIGNRKTMAKSALAFQANSRFTLNQYNRIV